LAWSFTLTQYVGHFHRSRSYVKVQGHSSTGERSPHGECVHCWRPLANQIKLRRNDYLIDNGYWLDHATSG